MLFGTYLSTPDTDKESGEGALCGNKFKYGFASMRGWRIDMEDAHLVHALDDLGSALFGVFDGHGGKEVALYCAKHFVNVLENTPSMAVHNPRAALKECFLTLDESLKREDVIRELKELGDLPDGPIDPTEADDLQAEAEMPIEELMAKYGVSVGANAMLKHSNDDNKKNEEGEESGGGRKRQRTTNAALEFLVGTPQNGEPNEFEEEEEEESEEETDTEDDAMDEDVDNSNVPPQQQQEGDDGVSVGNKRKLGSDSQDSSDKDSNQQRAKRRDQCTTTKKENTDDGDEKLHLDVPTGNEVDDDGGGPVMPQPGVSSGTTCTVAWVRGNKIWVANAGDSRAVLFRAASNLPLSQDHNLSVPSEVARVERAGGTVIDDRVQGVLNLSRAIGDHEFKKRSDLPAEQQMVSAEPDIVVETLNGEEEFLVIACDGIWNSMSNEEVSSFVRGYLDDGMHLKEICEKLCDACMSDSRTSDGTGNDNETTIIVVFQHEKNAQYFNSQALPKTIADWASTTSL